MKVELEYIASKPGLSPMETLIRLARVSNPGNQDNHATAPKLLRRLYSKKHWSPFDMIDMVVYIETSRAISAQILRHWSMRFSPDENDTLANDDEPQFFFQEFSQRYSSIIAFEPVELRRQAESNRQSSTTPYIATPEMAQRIEALLRESRDVYEELIQDGCSRETARFLLPECTQTRLYMKGSIRSWIHYIQARTYEGTQNEHQEVAEKAREILLSQMPELAELIRQ